MKVVGLLVCVLGWFIAVLSVEVSGVGAQLLVAVAGFLVACFGALKLVNGAHLKNAIWKV
jgi:multisubunit Na+/H+ antiporter MnhG subunit